jgi:hypothetical protein
MKPGGRRDAWVLDNVGEVQVEISYLLLNPKNPRVSIIIA